MIDLTPRPKAFQEAYSAIRENLLNCKTESFVPSLFEILTFIGGSSKSGRALSDRVVNAIEVNAITPAGALSTIQQIRQEVQEFHQAITEIVRLFTLLGIASDRPESGIYEIGVVIPPALVGNDLDGLRNELHELNKHFRTLRQLAGDGSADLKIRSIASSGLEFFLDSPYATATLFVAAIERVSALYKKVLEIRVLRRQLEDKDVPPAAISPIRDHETEMIEGELERIRDDLINSHGNVPRTDRRNELSVAFHHVLKFIANRIDKGTNFEVSTSPDETKPGAEESEESVGKEGSPGRTPITKGSIMRSLERHESPVLLVDYQPTDDDQAAGASPTGPMRKAKKRVSRGKDSRRKKS